MKGRSVGEIVASRESGRCWQNEHDAQLTGYFSINHSLGNRWGALTARAAHGSLPSPRS